jgi:uncharacterized protein
MDAEFICSRRALIQSAALLLAAKATPAFACVTIATKFGPAHYRFFKAAKKGDINAMHGVLQKGELKLADTVDWKTWLQWAIIENQPKAMISLLKIGADPQQFDDDGGNAVLDAAGHSNAKWLKILLANGASPDARHRNNGRTALFEALIANRDAQFAMLIAAKADLKSANSVGDTPLHIAGQINKPWHALDLLKAGADPLARNAQGQTFQRYLFMTKDTLLTRERRKGRQAVLDYLSINGIPINGDVPSRNPK